MPPATRWRCTTAQLGQTCCSRVRSSLPKARLSEEFLAFQGSGQCVDDICRMPVYLCLTRQASVTVLEFVIKTSWDSFPPGILLSRPPPRLDGARCGPGAWVLHHLGCDCPYSPPLRQVGLNSALGSPGGLRAQHPSLTGALVKPACRAARSPRRWTPCSAEAGRCGRPRFCPRFLLPRAQCPVTVSDSRQALSKCVSNERTETVPPSQSSEEKAAFPRHGTTMSTDVRGRLWAGRAGEVGGGGGRGALRG